MQFNGYQPEECGGGSEPNADPPQSPKMSPLPTPEESLKHGSIVKKRFHTKLLRNQNRYHHAARNSGYSGYRGMADAASSRYNRFVASHTATPGYGQKRTQAHFCTSTSESDTAQQDSYFYMQRKRQAIPEQRQQASPRAQAQVTSTQTPSSSSANARPQAPQKAKKGNRSKQTTDPRILNPNASNTPGHLQQPESLENASQSTGTLKQLLHVISSLIDKKCPCSHQGKDPECKVDELSHAEETEARLQTEWEQEQELHMEEARPMVQIPFNLVPMDQEKLHLNATSSGNDSPTLARYLGCTEHPEYPELSMDHTNGFPMQNELTLATHPATNLLVQHASRCWTIPLVPMQFQAQHQQDEQPQLFSMSMGRPHSGFTATPRRPQEAMATCPAIHPRGSQETSACSSEVSLGRPQDNPAMATYLGRPSGSATSPRHSLAGSSEMSMGRPTGSTAEGPQQHQQESPAMVTSLGRPSGSTVSSRGSSEVSMEKPAGPNDEGPQQHQEHSLGRQAAGPANLAPEDSTTEVIDVDQQAARKSRLWPFYAAFTQSDALDSLSSDSFSSQISKTNQGGGQGKASFL